MNKFYLTASIPYVNGDPHIGHTLEYIQGDVISRFHKQKGDKTYYISGADENAVKNVQAAEKEGISIQELVDKNAAKYIELAKVCNVRFDTFQRSSIKEHYDLVQDFWNACDASGDIYKKAYKGLYCVGCAAFIKEVDLGEAGDCKIHPGKKLEEVEEENYFFRLSKYQEELEKLISSDTYLIQPLKKKNEVLAFINQGLEDFSISRSNERAKNWGVPVPGDDSQRIYVWVDGLNVYRTADKENFWPADLHIIGKDIIRFHAIYWPAMLLSAKIDLPKELFVHGFITLNGQKMSKSLGNTIDPFELVEKYGVDPVRYYLLREIPSDGDGDFSEEKFVGRYNADLANGLGNLVSRVLALAEKANLGDEINKEILEKIEEAKEKVLKNIQERKLHNSLNQIWDLIRFADGYINQKEPWSLEDGAEKNQILTDLVKVVEEVSDLINPFLPKASEKIKKALAKEDERVISVSKLESSLFPRI